MFGQTKWLQRVQIQCCKLIPGFSCNIWVCLKTGYPDLWHFNCEPWTFHVHHFTISPYFSQTWMMGRFTKTYWNYDQWIGLGEKLQENLIFNGKNHGFPVNFPLNQSIDMMFKTVVSCRFPIELPMDQSMGEAKKRRTSWVEKLTTFCERERGWWRNNVAPQHWRCELFGDWKNWGFYQEK